MLLNNYQCESSQSTECLNQFNSPKNNTLFNKLTLHLSKLLQFDSLAILGYQDSGQPIFSFTSQEEGCDHLITEQDLVMSSYAYDSFESKHSTRSTQGVLTMILPLDQSRKVVILLRRDNDAEVFTSDDKCLLNSHFHRMKTLCKRFWPHDWFTVNQGESNNLVSLISFSLVTFGTDVLTEREKQVINLVIQGLDNKAIAANLRISIATVKVHRKSIYNKFEVSSLGELFQVFLNHLVEHSNQPSSVM